MTRLSLKMSVLARGVYIGRGTPVGNPFVIGRHGNREEVIEKYKRWLWLKIKDVHQANPNDTLRFLRLLQEEDVLLCWCHPTVACHGDVIIAAWKWMNEK